MIGALGVFRMTDVTVLPAAIIIIKLEDAWGNYGPGREGPSAAYFHIILECI